MDLLSNLTEDSTGAEVIDLLADMDEGGAPAWVAKEAGDGVQGTVLSLGSVKSSYKDATTGTFPDCPVVTLRQPDGKEIRVTGFQSVLRNEIEKAAPQVGDLFAAKYFGLKDGKGGTSYHHYKVAVRPGARTQSTPPYRAA